MKHYEGDNFLDGIAFYYPQIFLLLSIFFHVQKEIRLGILDLGYEDYESFEEGLRRYRIHVICKSELERRNLQLEYDNTYAI